MFVERGHRVAAEKPGAALRGRCDSFVAGTDVHHPTDRSLPMDAARCMVRDVSRACGGPGPPGWRRKEYLCGKLRKGYLRVATSRLANPRPGDVEAPLRLALKLADRAEAGRAETGGRLGIPGPSDSIRGFIGHVRPRADLTGRRILKGGTVPHRGKVHPISGPHTRWISKGKAGVPVEPGVPVRVPEDRHGFLPHRSVRASARLRAGVAAVGPELAHVRGRHRRLRDGIRRAVPVLDAGRMDHDGDRRSPGVHRDGPLPAPHLPARVVAAGSAAPHRPAVDGGGGGLLRTPRALSGGVPQGVGTCPADRSGARRGNGSGRWNTEDIGG